MAARLRFARLAAGEGHPGRDLALPLGVFTTLRDRRGALVGVGAALLTVLTDIAFTLMVSGTSGLMPHVISLGLTAAAGAVFVFEGARASRAR